jgi:sugar lactone lactonase YvrE
MLRRLRQWLGFESDRALGSRRQRYRLVVELLEHRLTPAYNLTIGAGPTAGVSHDSTGDFTANAPGATIAVSDILADLSAGKSVTIKSGSGGGQAGDIIWRAGHALIAALPAVQSLTVDATRHLTIASDIALGSAALTLAADADGIGVGTLTISAATDVTGRTVTLEGAAVNISTGTAPALVGAYRAPAITLTGLSGADALAFDNSGNLYVANGLSTTVSEFAPGATTPTSSLDGSPEMYLPESLAVDAQGDVWVGTSTDHGSVTEFSPGFPEPVLYLNSVGNPRALAVNQNGDLFIAISSTNTVEEVLAGSNDTKVFHGAPGATLGGPRALALHQGTLFVANYNSGTVSEFLPGGTTPGSATPTNTLKVNHGMSEPDALAVDAAGDLFVADIENGTVSEFAPQATKPRQILTGFEAPDALAIDASGDLYVADRGAGTVSEFAHGGTVPSAVFRGLFSPKALALDSNGDLFVTSGNSVIEFPPLGAYTASVTIRSSQPSRPMTIGGVGGAGVSVTQAELAQIRTGPGGSVTFGSATQTGTITFGGASLLSSTVSVVESTSGSGKIVLNGTPSRAALSVAGSASLSAGTGGIQVNAATGLAVAISSITVPVFGTITPTLLLASGGSIGSPTDPLATNAAQLGSGSVAGSLYLVDADSLTTTGTITAGGVMALTLGGSFSTQPGALTAVTGITFTFDGTGDQQFDSGGLIFQSLLHNGTGSLQLENHPLTLSGNLTNSAGTFYTNDHAVTVDGQTAVTGGTYFAAGGTQTFMGKLTVLAEFTSGSGDVSADGIVIGPRAQFTAPTGTLFDAGNWSSAGTSASFVANGGTVVLDGTHQRITGSTLFDNLTKSTTTADTLLFQSGQKQSVSGTLTLSGASGALLSLRSSAKGTQWLLDANGTQVVQFADVEDSDSIGTVIADQNGLNSGDNTHWTFPVNPPVG